MPSAVCRSTVATRFRQASKRRVRSHSWEASDDCIGLDGRAWVSGSIRSALVRVLERDEEGTERMEGPRTQPFGYGGSADNGGRELVTGTRQRFSVPIIVADTDNLPPSLYNPALST